MSSNHPRRAYRWRILCHGRGRSDGSWSAGNHRTEVEDLEGEPREHRNSVKPERTEFDELVVGQWLHVEEMDTRTWWMRVGDTVLWITVKPNGEAKSVMVE